MILDENTDIGVDTADQTWGLDLVLHQLQCHVATPFMDRFCRSFNQVSWVPPESCSCVTAW